jgi:alkylation response protein AidB-like acyl-CoA dehydrogenase
MEHPMGRLAATDGLTDIQEEICKTVRTFVEKEILPVATELEHRDEYPTQIVEGIKDLGVFGLMIPEEYGGPRRVAAHVRAGRRGDRPRLDERLGASSTPTSSSRGC